MKLAVLFTPVVLAGALAAGATSPASAQSLSLSPSTTLSTATLSEPAPQEPTLTERRSLAMAAFERLPTQREASVRRFAVSDSSGFETPLEMKEDWTDDYGVRVVGARVAYKTKF